MTTATITSNAGGMAVSSPMPNHELPLSPAANVSPSSLSCPSNKPFRSRSGGPDKRLWLKTTPVKARRIYGFRPGPNPATEGKSIAAPGVTPTLPVHGMDPVWPRIVPPPSLPELAVRAEMPEMDLYTPEGQLRRDVAVKVLERIDDRLDQLIKGSGPSSVRSAAQLQRQAIKRLAGDLAAKESSPQTRPEPAIAAAPTFAGLDIADSAKLMRVLRETHKAVCSPPTLFSRFLQWLRPASMKQATATAPTALLDMLLTHFDAQVLGGWAALVRENAEAVRMKKYAAYAHAGESWSTFLGGAATVPVAGDPLSLSVGIVAGATVLGRDLAGCEDGDIEQSKWWSGTLGAAFTFGLSWLKAKLTGTVTRRQGLFFSGVDHLVKSPEGNPHAEEMFDGVSASLMRAMGTSRFGIRKLKLSDLDVLEGKAYAQREIFAKVVGPISISAVDGEETPHTIRIDKQAPRIPPPCEFKSTRIEAAAGVAASFDLASFFSAGLNASIGHALMDLTIQSRKGFWQAIKDHDGDSGGMAAAAWRERVAALRDAGRGIAPALAHFPSVRRALESKGPDAAKEIFHIDKATIEQLRDFLTDLDREFDNYCHARRQIEAGMPRHLARARAIEASWGVKPGPDSMYAYVQRLHITHALIGLRLQEFGQAGDPPFKALWDKLDAPAMTSYRQVKARSCMTFSDETDLVEHYTPIDFGGRLTFDLQGALAKTESAMHPFGEKNPISNSAGPSVNFRAQARTRRDSNILRAGNYLDLSVDISLNGFLGIKIPQLGEWLLRHAAERGLDTGFLGHEISRIGQVLQDVFEPGLDPAAFCRVRLCYYQPGDAKGLDASRLQHVRVILGHRGPIHNQETVCKEILGSDTLSYVFMRHHAFFSQSDVKKREPKWATYCAAHSKELDEMMAKLGDPGSAIRAEAERYWAQIEACMADGPGRTGLIERREAFFRTMSGYAKARSLGADYVGSEAYNDARSALDAFADGHMTPWLQARAERVRHKALFELLD